MTSIPQPLNPSIPGHPERSDGSPSHPAVRRRADVVLARQLAWILERFGLAGFRHLQKEAITAHLLGQDSLCVMPTGSGKSLCYQGPAVLCREHSAFPIPHSAVPTTVVVSPLLALMQDQVDALQRRGISAAVLNSAQYVYEQRVIEHQVRDGEVALLHVSPERFASPAFITLLCDSPLSAIVVDEAHCVSMWGHDFRPDYAALGPRIACVRQAHPCCSLHAYTATATLPVRGDIARSLGLREPHVELVGSFDRENLLLRVERRVNLDRQLIDLCRAYEPGSGIIYCPRRADTEQLAEMLCHVGLDARAYHAGMETDLRREVQDWFMAPARPGRIAVATVAFGMGIDHPAVRFVAHTFLPSSLELYHQEIGRAGRDGGPAECVIFWTPDDVEWWRDVLFGEERYARREVEVDEDRALLSLLIEANEYCAATACRHAILLNHFDDPTEDCETMCDNCRTASQGQKGSRDQGTRDVGQVLAPAPEISNLKSDEPSER